MAEFCSIGEKEDWLMSFALLRFAALIICLVLPTTLARAETLPLPQSLIGAATDQGEALFLDADAREAYFPLASNFLTQQNQSFCGVASMVMVLNALELPAPAVPAFDPYRTFTQDNVLDARTEAVLPVEVIKKMGMTLDQLGGLLAVQPVTVSVRHAADSSVEAFRSQARDALAAPGQFVIVNYLRKAIGQERGGHISPLAAFDAESDRFLILDVARYKYPPVWVKTAELFAAMNTQDSDNENKTRGYVLIAKK
ncbi:MAG TPA: phytochelatin synthase family protein [Aestuariivirga sp.]